MRHAKNQGFTLVEILIVVVILGILAAIVIPQFSDASTQSKLSSCQSSLQSLRSQIQLYKIQHNDQAPTVALFEDAMTKCSAAGASEASDYVARTADNKTSHPFGPYVQQVPMNPWNNLNTVGAIGSGAGWEYNAATGDIYVGTTGAPTEVVTKLVETGAALGSEG